MPTKCILISISHFSHFSYIFPFFHFSFFPFSFDCMEWGRDEQTSAEDAFIDM